jgi:hypothetical protein
MSNDEPTVCERCKAEPRAKNYRLCERCVCNSNGVVSGARAIMFKQVEEARERRRRYGFSGMTR